MRPAEPQRGTAAQAAVPACPHCAARETELQETREQLAVLRADLEVAERGTQATLRDLENSREQYVDLYDFAPTAYVTLDHNGFICEANLTTAELLGEDRTKLRKTLFMRFVAHDDRQLYFRHLSRCRRGRYPAQITTDLSLRCGASQRQIHLISMPDHKADPSSRQHHYRTALVDLSEIRHAEQALRDSEARYRLLFEGNPSSMFVVAENTLEILDVNEAALRLYGYSREAFLAMTVKDLSEEANVSAAVAAFRRQRQLVPSGMGRESRRAPPSPGENFPLTTGELRQVKRDGTVFDAELTLNAIAYAGRRAHLVLVTDITARKRTEMALRESEARYRTIFDQAADSVVVFDPQTLAMVDFNTEACRHLGYSRKEFARLKISDFEVHESAAAVRRHARKVSSDRAEVFETQHRARNGAVLDLEVSAKAIYWGGRKLIHCLWRDITARKQVEAALRESEERYRIIFDQAADAVVVFDPITLAMVDFNDETCRLLGYSRHAFATLKMSDLEAQESAVELHRHVRKITERRIDVFETQFHTRTGAVLDMEVRAKAIFRDGRKLIHAIWHDITARKRTEMALRESEARYRTIFDQAADAVVVFDPLTLAIRDFNDEACRRLGYTRQEFARLKISDFEAVESPAATRRRTRAMLAPEGRMAAFETKQRAKDGTLLDIEIRAKLISLEGKTLIQGMWRDITARKQAEAELQRRVALERLLAAVSSRLVNVTADTLDDNIDTVLADVGLFMEADRCFLFAVTDDLTIADNTHEWCRQGIHAQRADLQNIPTAHFPWLLERLRNGEPLNLPRVADIPATAVAERQLMEHGKVKAVILVPIRHTGKLTGFVGCDAVRSERQWTSAEARLLRIVSETLADAQVRCRAEAALRTAAREWTATFDGVADAVWVLDDEQHVLRCNKSSMAIFGKVKDDIEGHLCWEIVHGTQKPVPDCPFSRMKRSHQRESMELALGGRWYQVVVDPLLDPDGKLHGAVHIVSDITARKQNEEVLRNVASELERRVTERTAEVQRLAAIVQHSSELVCLTTPDLRCVFINDAGARLLGTTSAEIGQHRLLDFLPEAELQRFQAEILPVVKKGRVWQGEMQYRNGVTGDIAYVAAAFFSIPDPATGRPLYLATTSIDITARKVLEHQVLEISEREQRRIGHDLHDSLGQQLAAVKFMSGTLSKRLAKDKLAHALAAAQIERELQHAMEEVRTISRGLHPIRPEGTSLQSALYEMAAGTTRLFKQPCHFACPRRVVVPDVHAATHLFRIAQEAVNNASRHARAKHIWIRLQRNRRGIRLRIEDDGCGLPAGGTAPKGLGLKIMSYRASVIGATFSIAPRQGGGTRITCDWKPSESKEKAPSHDT